MHLHDVEGGASLDGIANPHSLCHPALHKHKELYQGLQSAGLAYLDRGYGLFVIYSSLSVTSEETSQP